MENKEVDASAYMSDEERTELENVVDGFLNAVRSDDSNSFAEFFESEALFFETATYFQRFTFFTLMKELDLLTEEEFVEALTSNEILDEDGNI
jgi:saccharopine dehydrogenase-like NADP-dependent oxidoreductase